MLKVKLGKEKLDNFGYQVSDHKGKVLKETGNYKKHAVNKTLEKARGGMIGDLKITMRDKDLKKDHYKELGKK